MSLLDKIKQEHQAPTVKVPPRKDDLVPTAKQEPAEPKLAPAPKKAEVTQPQQQVSHQLDVELETLEKELESFPAITNKKLGVRLEEVIYERLRRFCQDNSITLETLLEAYFTVCEPDSKLMARVIDDAQNRIKRRTKAGNIRSLLTKTKNLKGS
jgi:hypothetical protein